MLQQLEWERDEVTMSNETNIIGSETRYRALLRVSGLLAQNRTCKQPFAAYLSCCRRSLGLTV